MQVQKVQANVAFQANKTRYIGEDSHEQLIQILRKMDKETVYKSNEYTFESTRTTRVELYNHDKGEKIARLVDTRRDLDRIPEGKDLYKETLLTIGKTQLVIDNKSGNIIDYYKPFLTSWKKVFKQLEKVLVMINASYNMNGHVRKHQFNLKGFTEKGAEIIRKIKV